MDVCLRERVFSGFQRLYVQVWRCVVIEDASVCFVRRVPGDDIECASEIVSDGCQVNLNPVYTRKHQERFAD